MVFWQAKKGTDLLRKASTVLHGPPRATRSALQSGVDTLGKASGVLLKAAGVCGEARLFSRVVQVSTRILGRRMVPFVPLLVPCRVPRGFTQDPSTDKSQMSDR